MTRPKRFAIRGSINRVVTMGAIASHNLEVEAFKIGTFSIILFKTMSV